MKTITLYSKRWTVAHGWHWRIERECNTDQANQWLAVFIKDEPDVEFRLSKRKPKI